MFICEKCGKASTEGQAKQSGQASDSKFYRCGHCGSYRITWQAENRPKATDYALPSGLAVNQDHYNASGKIQPIEVMQASMAPEEFIGFLRGNVIKYACRAGKKDETAREVDKVIQYATWWRAALDGKTIDPRAGQ